MRILLIGNFAPPYEEENLHNLSLLNKLREDGHECSAINIGEVSVKKTGKSNSNKIAFITSYFDFLIKLVRYCLGCNIIHILTKGYTRPGLMKLITTVFISRIMMKKVVITLHSEMFSVFGRLRSKMGGQQLLHLSFLLADRIICSDTHTFDVASLYCRNKDKFSIIPTFFQIPEEKEKSPSSLDKLDNKKNIIVFSGVKYPSLMFDVLNELLIKYLEPDSIVVISISELKAKQLQHVIEESHKKLKDRLIFIGSSDVQMLSTVYAKASIVIRTLSCDCKSLFNSISLILKIPRQSLNSLYFPLSMIFIKEGEVTNMLAFVINRLLLDKSDKYEVETEDLFQKIKGIYLQYN